jgi:putative NADPH-quinone reductase
MKTLIIYYSYTGNNKLLAEKVRETLDADIFQLEDVKPRTMKSIVLDMLFQKKPRIKAMPENISSYELVVFMGPIWMFHLPSPLRSCMHKIKRDIKRYAFISVSGGALGPNTGIAKELVKRLGKKLAVAVDFNIAQFCTVSFEATTKDTGEYKLSDHPEDLQRLTDAASHVLMNIRA